MKLRIILLSVMLLCPSLIGMAQEHFPFLGETTTDKVSVRAGQNVNFERVDILPLGTQIVVLQEQFGWYKIQLPVTAKAYIRVDYLTVENDSVGRIAGNRVNVRAGRGVNSSPLGQLEKGKYVRLVNKLDDWFQIVPVEGLYGWISKDFVSLKSETIPSMDSLGLAPITQPSIIETDIASRLPQPLEATTLTINGTVEPVSPAEMLNNASYRLKTEEGKIYYLQVHPAVIGNFTHDVVQVEGRLVDGVASLEHPVVAVSKFQLIL